LNHKIMGKPQNQHHAQEMLLQLSGITHQVYSAVSVRRGGQHWEAVNITEVTFRQITLTEMQQYWQTGEPCDKAGGYAIQGLGSLFIEKISGSFSGVMGLPLFETAQLLQQQGIFVLK
jgi:septum formation protein